jgi:hypothetical protein
VIDAYAVVRLASGVTDLLRVALAEGKLSARQRSQIASTLTRAAGDAERLEGVKGTALAGRLRRMAGDLRSPEDEDGE